MLKLKFGNYFMQVLHLMPCIWWQWFYLLGGFRFAVAISNEPNTPLMAKIVSSAYFVIVAMMFYGTAEVGGIMAAAAANQLVMLPEMSSGAQEFIERVEAGRVPGGPLSVALNVVILFMQLTMTWLKKS